MCARVDGDVRLQANAIADASEGVNLRVRVDTRPCRCRRLCRRRHRHRNQRCARKLLVTRMF
jgi:hypothetical protein